MTNAARFPCPCCGFLTLSRAPPGTYELCPICYWEDDFVQFNDPEYRGGANRESLAEARQNFAAFGAIAETWRRCVRPPRADEYPPPMRNGS
ncbi:MAG TPA: CPCC family cysteine-rich protein [Chloroflexota bacterium]|nr:CPCC family cysteine-rich protein [Chloroflexota bacterium]